MVCGGDKQSLAGRAQGRTPWGKPWSPTMISAPQSLLPPQYSKEHRTESGSQLFLGFHFLM